MFDDTTSEALAVQYRTLRSIDITGCYNDHVHKGTRITGVQVNTVWRPWFDGQT